MRNLKRILSLTLALTMLLGMVTVGAEAAPTTEAQAPAVVTVSAFKDADQITYTEEVSIMAGMGLFAGTTDGKFDPAGTVTRAQMVTVLVKALRGNNFNANAFKGTGVNPFPDTASFEGGWAEGYITAGYQMGIVGGYGDGTFKPGKAVTTAEALTMIINALGVDAGEGEWPSTIMVKAEEMKLYGDLTSKPGTNDPVNREQLAVITYEGMCYSPKGVTGYKVPGVDIVFTNIADAMKAHGGVTGITQVVGEDALANQIYELKVAKGFVTTNQDTGFDLTTIRPLKADGSLDAGVEFFVQTDLDLVGHYVTIYYKDFYKGSSNPGQVYTIVDETTVVTLEEDADSSQKYKAAFGKSYQLKDTSKAILFDGEYKYTAPGTIPASEDGTTYVAGNSAPAGTYFVADGVIAGYMAPATVYASRISSIITASGKESISLYNRLEPLSNTEGKDLVLEYDGIAKDDYVTYRVVQGLYLLEKVNAVSGIVTSIATDTLNRQVLTVNEKAYTAFTGQNDSGKTTPVDTSTFNFNVAHDLYVTADDQFLFCQPSTGTVDLTNTVYVLGTLSVDKKDAYGDTNTYYYARGVDMTGTEVMLLHGVTELGKTYGSTAELAAGYYTVADATEREAAKRDIQALTPVSTQYDKETSPVFAATHKSSYFASSARVGGTMFISNQTSSRYIIVDGAVDQATELETSVSVGTGNLYFASSTEMQLLLSYTGNGSYLVEAMVIANKDLDEVAPKEVIYVSASQTEPVGTDANGWTYEVYDAELGALRQITMTERTTLSTGFHFVTFDSQNSAYKLGSKVTQGKSSNNQTGSSDYRADGLVNASVFYDQKLLNLMNTNMTTIGVKRDPSEIADSAFDGYGVYMENFTKAVVIDTRTEDELFQSIIPEITSLDQIITMWDTNPNYIVHLDIYFNNNKNTEQVKAIYVKFVGTKDAMLWTAADPRTATDPSAVPFIVVDAGGTDWTVGQTITLDLKNDYPTRVCKGTYCGGNHSNYTQYASMNLCAGFYQLDTPNQTLTHLPATASQNDYSYQLGQHNLPLELSDGSLYLVNAHTSTLSANGTTPPATESGQCYQCCYDNGPYVYEASKLLNVSAATPVVDTTGNGLATIADVMALCASKDVILDYYCAEGEGDNEPELILVTAVENRRFPNRVTVKTGDLFYATTKPIYTNVGSNPTGFSSREMAIKLVRNGTIGETVTIQYHKICDSAGTVYANGKPETGYYIATVSETGLVTLTHTQPDLPLLWSAVDPRAAADQTAASFIVVEPGGTNWTVGQTITLDVKNDYNKHVCSGSYCGGNSGDYTTNKFHDKNLCAGFYQIDASKQTLTHIPAAYSANNFSYKLGQHNLPMALNDNSLTLINAHISAMDATSDQPTGQYCYQNCFDNGKYIYEASKLLTVSATTPVVDPTENGLATVADVMALCASKDVILDYYCAQGKDDNEPELIIVAAVEEQRVANRVAVKTGDVFYTDSKPAYTNISGNTGISTKEPTFKGIVDGRSTTVTIQYNTICDSTGAVYASGKPEPGYYTATVSETGLVTLTHAPAALLWSAGDPRSAADQTKVPFIVVEPGNTDWTAGKTITLDLTKDYPAHLCNGSFCGSGDSRYADFYDQNLCSGFYLAGPQMLAHLPASNQAAHTYSYKLGHHNLPVALEDNELFLVHAHNSISASATNPDQCAQCCYDSGTYLYDASKLLTVSATTPVVDASGNGLTIADVMALAASNDVILDYYCAQGKDDNEPELIIVSAVQTQSKANRVAVKTGDVFYKSTAPAYTPSGKYTRNESFQRNNSSGQTVTVQYHSICNSDGKAYDLNQTEPGYYTATVSETGFVTLTHTTYPLLWAPADPRAAADQSAVPFLVVEPGSTGWTVGQWVTLDMADFPNHVCEGSYCGGNTGKYQENDFHSKNLCAGFYQVDAQILTHLPATFKTSSYDYKFGYHNLPLALDGTSLHLINAHTGAMPATADRPTVDACYQNCYDVGKYGYEASKLLTVSRNTPVVDASDSGLSTINAVMLAAKGSDVILDYYCAQGKDDAEPELIIVVAVEDRRETNRVVVKTGDLFYTESKPPYTNISGNTGLATRKHTVLPITSTGVGSEATIYYNTICDSNGDFYANGACETGYYVASVSSTGLVTLTHVEAQTLSDIAGLPNSAIVTDLRTVLSTTDGNRITDATTLKSMAATHDITATALTAGGKTLVWIESIRANPDSQIPARLQSCPDDPDDHTTDSNWKSLNETLATLTASGGYYTVPAGHYYLTDNIDVSNGSLVFKNDATLCLNGYQITGTPAYTYAVQLNAAKRLDICDCKGTGKISVDEGTSKKYVFAADGGGTFNMYGGTVENCTVRTCVNVQGGATFNMYGGSFLNNNVNMAVLRAQGGTVNVAGRNATISGNYTGLGTLRTGSNASSVITVSAGTIDPTEGNVIYGEAGSISVTGGSLKGAITVKSGTTPTITISGGKFSADPTSRLDADYRVTNTDNTDLPYQVVEKLTPSPLPAPPFPSN